MIQSVARGYLARKQFNAEYGDLLKNKEGIIKIQAAARGYLQRKKYNERKQYLKDNEDSIIKVK